MIKIKNITYITHKQKRENKIKDCKTFKNVSSLIETIEDDKKCVVAVGDALYGVLEALCDKVNGIDVEG